MSDSKLVTNRRSGWSTVFRLLGAINFFIFVIAIGWGKLQDLEPSMTRIDSNILFWVGVFGFLGGIQCYFFAFLVDVFTDIRWFVSQIAERQMKDEV